MHLDRWWGLANRERQIRDNAMFRVRYVFTADGDHGHLWEAEGVNHHWLPPGVYEPECVPGTPRAEWRADVAFIGNWRDYGHAEHWQHRKAMIDALATRFGDRASFWPRDGEPAPWGLDYNDMLASVGAVVGDGWSGARHYFSNRCFETVGRGGFCVHPAVPGLVELLPEGMGVAYFAPGDWPAMCETIERWLGDDAGRADARAKGQQYVREHHSYTQRMTEMLTIMADDGAFR